MAFVCDGKQRLDGKLVLKAEEDRADAISQWALALAAAIDQLRPSEQGVEVERRISNERRLACASQSVSRSLSGLRVTSCRQSRVSAGERRASITERERAAALGKQLSFSEASCNLACRKPKRTRLSGAAVCCLGLRRTASGLDCCCAPDRWLRRLWA